jgi:serine/threonine-protein kinase HipA
VSDAVSVLEVLLHGRSIGTITRTAGDTTLFAFNSGYIEDAARPTLGLTFKTAEGVLRTRMRTYQTKLMPYFSNLLPEGHLRQYLSERGKVHPEREFFLLMAARGRPAGGAADYPSPRGRTSAGVRPRSQCRVER